MQPKLIHPENESPPVTVTSSLSLCTANFQKRIVAVSTLLRSLGINILNGFDEELDDRSNDKHELWSVTQVLLPENEDFLNCTVLESLLEYESSIPLYSGILVPHSST